MKPTFVKQVGKSVFHSVSFWHSQKKLKIFLHYFLKDELHHTTSHRTTVHAGKEIKMIAITQTVNNSFSFPDVQNDFGFFCYFFFSSSKAPQFNWEEEKMIAYILTWVQFTSGQDSEISNTYRGGILYLSAWGLLP